MQIPSKNSDLRRYVIKKQLLRATGLAAWLLAFWVGAMMYNRNHQTYPPERLMTEWRLVGWMAIALVTGCLLFRAWKLVFPLPRRGRVLSTGLSHSYTSSEDPGTLSGTRFDFRLRTALCIRLPNGKKRKLRFEQKIGSYAYYHEGAELVRFYGLPYPIDLDPKAPNGYVCVACGRIHSEKHTHCTSCGLSLIDPADLSAPPGP